MPGNLASFNALEQACFQVLRRRSQRKNSPGNARANEKENGQKLIGRVFVSDLVAEY